MAKTSPRRAPVNSSRRKMLVLIPISRERRGQAGQFVTGEIALALDFGIALDALARIALAHVPADRQREHATEHRDRAIGCIRTAVSGDPAVAEMGFDAVEQLLVVRRRAFAVAR
jgi:hypothetical protein